MSKKTEYFGGFFWVALVSFIVPFFVGWKAFQKLEPTTKPSPVVDASGVDHKIWDYLLKSYVSEGLVDYEGMKKDYLFWEYLREIGQCDPDALETNDDKLALACNAYNALVIHGVINHKINDNVMLHKFGEADFFGVEDHLYAGKPISLDHLEHQMIRPVFKEPRVHVALVCGARSCPAIRPEAYVGDRIQDQLQDQSCQFANSPKYVMFDADASKLKLSSILQWYGSDFDERCPEGSYLAWIKELTEPELTNAKDDPSKEKLYKSLQALHDAIDDAIVKANKLLKDPEFKGTTLADAIKELDEVSFFEYDWTLNSQAEPGKSAAAGTSSGGFGSGSSPDS